MGSSSMFTSPTSAEHDLLALISNQRLDCEMRRGDHTAGRLNSEGRCHSGLRRFSDRAYSTLYSSSDAIEDIM
jgi:hypothetical protein